jgi:addiction module RelE/StbE family toxin
MKIKYHKRFEKQFKKLLDRDKKMVLQVIEKFIKNPKDKSLRKHSLKGALLKNRAISVNPSLRIIFEEFDSYTLVLTPSTTPC